MNSVDCELTNMAVGILTGARNLLGLCGCIEAVAVLISAMRVWSIYSVQADLFCPGRNGRVEHVRTLPHVCMFALSEQSMLSGVERHHILVSTLLEHARKLAACVCVVGRHNLTWMLMTSTERIDI